MDWKNILEKVFIENDVKPVAVAKSTLESRRQEIFLMGVISEELAAVRRLVMLLALPSRECDARKGKDWGGEKVRQCGKAMTADLVAEVRSRTSSSSARKQWTTAGHCDRWR